MKKLGLLCIVLGVLMALVAGVWYLYNERDEERAGTEAQEALEQLSSAISEGRQDEPTEQPEPAAGEELPEEPAEQESSATDRERESEIGEHFELVEMPTVTIDGYAYIGYLSLPEIGLELPVQADWSMEKLEKSPARYAGSLEEGNLIVLGHNYKRHFTPLKKMSVGGRVVFTDVNGNEHDYVVSQILTVAGYDAQTMLSGSDKWDLTLFTCTYGGESRLTLRCTLKNGSI